MTDKAVLRRKLKKKIPSLAKQKCQNQPGYLAVYVARTDDKNPVPGVQVDARGPTAGNASTEADGWAIFKDRTPGSYQAAVKMPLPSAVAKFRLQQGTQDGAVPACDAEILEFELSPPPKVGVALSFHPVLFRKLAFPASKDEFSVLATPEFDSFELLADGESEAIIRLNLVRLDNGGKVVGRELTLAAAGEHFDEGAIVLQLSTADYGDLKYGNQRGVRITVPIKEISSGQSALDKTNGVVFTTSRKIGKTKLTASITGNAQYEYVQSFAVPKGARERLELELGSRKVGKGTLGYDGMKVQWFLRKAGFLAYSEQALNKDNAASEWKDVKDIVLDGDFGAGSARCLRDFQRVARGKFRNQARPNVAATLNQVSPDVTESVISELLEWRKQDYTVEPYNGYVQLKVTEGVALEGEARIVYGALVNGDDPKGYVEVVDPIGQCACHWDGRRVVVADAIRSAIKLFTKTELKFRLHDADPKAVLDDQNLNPTLATNMRTTVRTLRREQKAESTGADARDVYLYEGHRTVERQNQLYAKGRTANGEPCKHGDERRDVGTCTEHPLGSTVTNAQGSSMSSWHQFGLAVDLIFNNAKGNPVWGDDKNWDRNGEVAKNNSLHWGGDWDDEDPPHIQLPADDSPGQNHKDAYSNTSGTVLQKLQAVWALI